MTEMETKVIGLLVRAAHSADLWRGPIHDVDAAMHWDSETTRKFVKGLRENGLIIERTNATDRAATPNQVQDWWWERADG
jgi:hypothetical protein